ncbi:MAG: SPL family radical SAM protein [Thermodesulfobacteriota bacterium]
MISRLYIDRAVEGHPLVKRIQERFKAVPHTLVDDSRKLYQEVDRTDDPIQSGKELLFLTENKGPFLKKCPGTRSYRCCDYTILHIASFCTMDCAYCILQIYFHPAVLQFFVNHEKLMTELDAVFASGVVTRIGTGEFTDSLIWESLCDLTPRLVSRFAAQNSCILELKTKTTAIGNLKNLAHNRKTILSWSLNTERVIRTEERRTTPLKARLKAAEACQQWGYPLSFHFDPLVIYDHCEDEYREVIAALFDRISPDNIVWISLGSFRFMPELKPLVQRRFPHSRIVYGEFIPGLDGKMRYFKPMRIALYKEILHAIRSKAPEVTVYFCMEDDDVWLQCLGFVPADRGGLPGMLDESAVRHCGVRPGG